MSTPGPTPSSYPDGIPPGAPAPSREGAIKLISHSNLFYWWPVWVLGFFMAFWTYFEGSHLAIVPSKTAVKSVGGETDTGVYEFTFKDKAGNPHTSDAVKQAASLSGDPKNEPFPMHVSRHPTLGVLFVIVLVLTIIVTNVPLRGLWSFIVLLGVALVSVIISLIPGAWDKIFESFAALRIHINMAGYLFIAVAVVILWAVSTFIFDRRAYVLFTPGQIKVCEHIGAAVETYPTLGVSLTKQRDDLFRHYIFGFGSGDLILKFNTGERREIRIPNVLGIGWQLQAVEDMLRTLPSRTV